MVCTSRKISVYKVLYSVCFVLYSEHTILGRYMKFDQQQKEVQVQVFKNSFTCWLMCLRNY